MRLENRLEENKKNRQENLFKKIKKLKNVMRVRDWKKLEEIRKNN